MESANETTSYNDSLASDFDISDSAVPPIVPRPRSVEPIASPNASSIQTTEADASFIRHAATSESDDSGVSRDSKTSPGSTKDSLVTESVESVETVSMRTTSGEPEPNKSVLPLGSRRPSKDLDESLPDGPVLNLYKKGTPWRHSARASSEASASSRRSSPQRSSPRRSPNAQSPSILNALPTRTSRPPSLRIQRQQGLLIFDGSDETDANDANARLRHRVHQIYEDRRASYGIDSIEDASGHDVRVYIMKLEQENLDVRMKLQSYREGNATDEEFLNMKNQIFRAENYITQLEEDLDRKNATISRIVQEKNEAVNRYKNDVVPLQKDIELLEEYAAKYDMNAIKEAAARMPEHVSAEDGTAELLACIEKILAEKGVEEELRKTEEQKREAQEDARSKAEEYAREVDERARIAEEKAREGEHKAVAAEEQARAAEERARVAEKRVQVIEGQLQAVEEQARAAQEKAAQTEETARAAEQKLSLVEDKLRVTEDKLRVAEDSKRAAQEEAWTAQQIAKKAQEEVDETREETAHVRKDLLKAHEETQKALEDSQMSVASLKRENAETQSELESLNAELSEKVREFRAHQSQLRRDAAEHAQLEERLERAHQLILDAKSASYEIVREFFSTVFAVMGADYQESAEQRIDEIVKRSREEERSKIPMLKDLIVEHARNLALRANSSSADSNHKIWALEQEVKALQTTLETTWTREGANKALFAQIRDLQYRLKLEEEKRKAEWVEYQRTMARDK